MWQQQLLCCCLLLPRWQRRKLCAARCVCKHASARAHGATHHLVRLPVDGLPHVAIRAVTQLLHNLVPGSSSARTRAQPAAAAAGACVAGAGAHDNCADARGICCPKVTHGVRNVCRAAQQASLRGRQPQQLPCVPTHRSCTRVACQQRQQHTCSSCTRPAGTQQRETAVRACCRPLQLSCAHQGTQINSACLVATLQRQGAAPGASG